MTKIGVREARNRFSEYVRRAEKGERIAITAHGRTVAELGPPPATSSRYPDRWNELVAAGLMRPPLEAGNPFEGIKPLNLPPGTAAALIDEDRGD